MDTEKYESLKRITAERLKEARAKAGLTQAEVADELGIATSTYTQFEVRNNLINTLYLPELHRIFNRPVAWFLGLPDERGLADDEIELVETYRNLPDDSTKRMIRRVLRESLRDFYEEGATPPPDDPAPPADGDA